MKAVVDMKQPGQAGIAVNYQNNPTGDPPWMDEIHFAPPKTPWNESIPRQIPTNNGSNHVFQVVGKDCATIHSMTLRLFQNQDLDPNRSPWAYPPVSLRTKAWNPAPRCRQTQGTSSRLCKANGIALHGPAGRHQDTPQVDSSRNRNGRPPPFSRGTWGPFVPGGMNLEGFP